MNQKLVIEYAEQGVADERVIALAEELKEMYPRGVVAIQLRIDGLSDVTVYGFENANKKVTVN